MYTYISLSMPILSIIMVGAWSALPFIMPLFLIRPWGPMWLFRAMMMMLLSSRCLSWPFSRPFPGVPASRPVRWWSWISFVFSVFLLLLLLLGQEIIDYFFDQVFRILFRVLVLWNHFTRNLSKLFYEIRGLRWRFDANLVFKLVLYFIFSFR